MKAWLALVLLPPLVFLLPWTVALARRRRGLAAMLFVLWSAGWACALWLWFGVGLTVLAVLGLAVVFTTTIELPS
jgi:hypothetical protein